MSTVHEIDDVQRPAIRQSRAEIDPPRETDPRHDCSGSARTPVTLHSDSPRRPGRGYLFAKRAFDIAVASAALVVLAPLMLAIAIAIRLDTPGPAIFCHRRSGADRRSGHNRRRSPKTSSTAADHRGPDQRNGSSRRRENEFGKPFTLYKFRTMYSDARERFPDSYRYEFSDEELRTVPIKVLAAGHRDAEGKLVPDALGEDPRVTRVGHWLRRTSLDELPNFINVLTGDLSVVGPRPDIALNIRHYDAEHMELTRVKPGVTGLAQVRGRGHLTLIETNEQDLEYVRNMSFMLDLKIVLLTIRDCVTRRGAY